MKSNNTSTEEQSFELKGSVLTVIVLHIKKTDTDQLYSQLEKKIGQARSFFNNAPILIDLCAVDEENQVALDFMVLVDTLRGLGLVPVGVRGVTTGRIEQALQAGLGLLPAVKTEKTVETCMEDQASLPESAEEKNQPAASGPTVPDQASGSVPTKIITHPVRSGQQVFAPHGDLVVLSSVNAGAEVFAAGNIHVYGALRGRAMAGINGDSTARIFSLQCNPELVAIAGEYRVNDLLNKDLINQSVMTFLRDGRLRFEIMGSFHPFS